MKKVSLLILVSLILLLAFTSCDMLPESVSGKLEDFKVKVEIMIGLHEHAWTEATCESAKTCETCGATEGEALGHNWSDATCDAPKTCSVCAKTEGAALGHKWVDATCDTPKTCSVCKKTEGAALGHKWTAASCDSAKTCSVCGETDGAALGHAFTNYVSNGDATCTADGTKTAKCDRCDVTDTITDEGTALGHVWEDATCTAPKTCKVCGETEGEALGHKWVDATCYNPKYCEVCGVEDGPYAHNIVHIDAVEPYCHFDGNIEYWYCSLCGATWEDEALTKVTNRLSVVRSAEEKGEVIHVEAIAAGCHYDGNIEYWYCTNENCAQVWQDEALTQLTNFKNVVLSATGEGNVVYMPAVEPGCHDNGCIEHWICYECEKVWQDEALTQLTNILSVTLPAKGSDRLVHREAIEPGCHYDGQIEHWICYECEKIWSDVALTQLTNSKNVIVPAVGGDVIHVEAVAPTCDSIGNIEYWYCENCMQVWEDEALTRLTNMMSVKRDADHTNLQHFEAVAPGCHYNGNIEYWHCYDCEKVWTDEALTLVSNVKSVVLPATGEGDLHHFDAIAPGCHYDGNVEYWICYTCEQVWTDEALTQLSNVKNVVLGATNDPAAIHVEAKPATCYENGNIEYWYCEQCGQVWQDEARTQLTNRMNVIVPAGHTNLVHMDAVEAGCHYTGNTEYWICYGCETVWADEALTQITNVKNVIIPAKGSNLLVHNEAIEPGCHYDGQIEHWICYECEQVWADEALTQLTNVKNVILPATNDPAAIHVEAVAPSCTENGNIEYWYCENCEQVWADEARTQLTNRMNVILPAAGHDMTGATCQTPATCSVCGETGELGCHALVYDEFENAFYCIEDGCEEKFTIAEGYYYDGTTADFTFNKNGGFTAAPNADGEIEVLVTEDKWATNSLNGREGAQHMAYLPSANNNELIFKDFSCEKNAFGVISFRIKSNSLGSFTVAVCKPRNDTANWTGWATSSINLLTIGGTEGANGAIDISGGIDANTYFTSVALDENGWSEWIDVKMFIQLKDDYTFTVSYYINGEFYNAYSRNLANPGEGKNTLDNYKVQAVYINGWTYELGTGYVMDDFVFGYATDSDWHFDGHKHAWVDATCTDAKYCELCGEVEGEALGHTDGEVVKENVVLPNCTEAGSHEEVVYCTVCGAEVSRTLVVDEALGHTEEVVPGYAATCTEYGLSDGAKCSVCGVTTLAQESIAPLGHSDEDGDELCDVCGADLACKHPTTEPVEGKAPTCTATGLTAAEKCTVCQEIIGQEVIPALGHTAAEAVAEEVVLPTCTEAGSHYDAVYCSVCNELISRTKVVDAALDHDYIDNAAQAPDCTNAGWDAYQTCSRCDYTTKVEIPALGHDLSAATCQAGKACSRCDYTEGEANPIAHVLVHDGATNTYSCELCEYSYKIEVGNYSNGTNYNGISANAPDNATYYTTNPDNDRYPVLAGDYLEFVRKTDAEGVDNTKSAQLQLWLPSTGGSNMFAGFSSANHANGYLSFSINAYTDYNFEMKLVDNTTDYIDVNGDGVVDQATERIRWGDLWAINDPVFRIAPPADGKVELKGFNGVILAVVDVDENNYTGWVDVAINIVLDPDTDTVIANYYINGSYVVSSSRPLSIHSNSINCVYLNSNNTAAGSGYKIDNLAFGYTAHSHDLEITEANGVMTLACACGASYTLEDYREWNGDGNDDHFDHGPNGKVDTVYNEDGTWGFIFNPVEDKDWASYGEQKGGQLQPWIPSSTRNEHTLSGFSCENNAVGVIAFTMKTNVTRHADRDTNITLGVGKPRNAGDWNDGGSWTDDQIQILVIEDYLETGVVIKGGVNASMNLATIPVADGWSEWFDVMISIEMLDTGYMNTYYYINGVYCGSYSRDLSKADADGRYLNPKEIEAFQFSGWTFAANTGILFDDLVFGYTAGGHNVFNGQYHKLTETTCGEKSTCVCGWTGYTLAHDLTEATCGAPATCKGCGMTVGSALTHNNLTASTANGVTTYACSDCGKQYVADSHNLYYDGSAQIGSWGVNGDITSTVVDGYNAVINKETDGTYFNSNGNQFMTWIPSQSTPAEFDGFTCANNAIGLASFKIKAYTDSVTGVEFKVNDGRGTNAWSAGPTANGWSDCSVGIFTIKPVTSADATTAEIRGLNGNALTTVPLAEGSKWTEWLDVALLIKLSDDNKISVDYYINSAFVGNITMNMPIYTGKISSFYINGYTKGDDTGYYLDDLAFGYTLNGLQEVEVPFYTSEIAAEDVTSETLKTLVASKIKQYDQCTAVNTQGGTPVYVLAEKDGAEVEALYFSRTYAWAGTEAEQFSEFRFAVNGEQAGPAATKISFDYKIDGTVEKNERYEFTGLKGEKFYADAYVQVKTPATHELATDNYPELSGTDLVLDGEWHTMTYTFDEPLVIIDILLNLYHFQGELLISNLVIEYAE